MNKNKKIAKELLKIAKKLCATNPSQNVSDTTTHYLTENLSIQQFLDALKRYIEIRERILQIIQSEGTATQHVVNTLKQDLLKIINQNSQQLQNYDLSNIDDTIEDIKKKMPEGTLESESPSHLSFQTAIESLVKTRKALYFSLNKSGKFNLEVKSNASHLMLRIGSIVRANEKLKYSINATTDEYQQLITLLEQLSYQLKVKESKQKGDKNSDLFVNQKAENGTPRVRLNEPFGELIDLVNNGTQLTNNTDILMRNLKILIVPNDKKMSFINSILSKLTFNARLIMGFLYSINNCMKSTYGINRKNNGIVDVDNDIPQQKGMQMKFMELIDFDAMKNLIKSKQDNLIQLIETRREKNEQLEAKENEKDDIVKTIEEQKINQTMTFFQIKKLLSDLLRIKMEIKNLRDEITSMRINEKKRELRTFTEQDVDLLLDESGLKGGNLTVLREHKQQLLDYLNSLNDIDDYGYFKSPNFINILNASKKTKKSITAGFFGDTFNTVKGYVVNIIGKFKNLLSDITDKLQKLINDFYPGDRLDEDINKLDEDINEKQNIRHEIEKTDAQLMKIFEQLKKINL